MRVLDLFSGIGGFSLGLERASMTTVAFCEIDPFCRQVLAKHWPGVPIIDDVREVTADVGPVDVIAGGFPCQDLSISGLKKGVNGERSGLYKEMLRVSSLLRPKFIIFENVTNLLAGESGKWFSRFLNDLATIGYDAQWHCIPASCLGAVHNRDRVWIVAYNNEVMWNGAVQIYNYISNQIGFRGPSEEGLALLAEVGQLRFDENEPDHRKDDGLSRESYRHGVLGNAVVPQVVEVIGRAIMAANNTAKVRAL